MKTQFVEPQYRPLLSYAILLAAFLLVHSGSGAMSPEAASIKSQLAIPFGEIGARATAGYQGEALGITPTADGAFLRCEFQRLAGRVTPRGLRLESTEPGGQDGLRLVATALGRISSPSLGSRPSIPVHPTGAVTVSGKLVRWTRPGLTEEFRVSVDGLRQDFLVEARPEGTGELCLDLTLSGAQARAAAGGAKLILDASRRELAYNRLRVVDARGRELKARLVVVSAEHLAVAVEDSSAAYPVRIDPTFSDADWVGLNPELPGANGVVYAIAASAGGQVYVGGGFTAIGNVLANRIAQWNGSSWSALSGGLDERVMALALDGTDLFVGGYFTQATNLGDPVVNARFIAKWNGNAWSALDTGMNNAVMALAKSGTDLYAAGHFTAAGGGSANRVAKWNGASWSSLGTGTDNYINALAVSGTTVYVGGVFTQAGGISASRIARWDGTEWSALGSGMNAEVNALAMSGTDLYAGGSFATAGGVTVNRVARWQANGWSALGSGVGGPGDRVHALAACGSELYAGGTFTGAGSTSARSIARWDGTAWSVLGSGIDAHVYAIAACGSDVYAGGDFRDAGGVTANYLARWTSSGWSALGSGMDSEVYALAVSGSLLYAGGVFRTAGGVVAPLVAKWDGSSWSSVGSADWTAGGGVSALAVAGTDLYAGGNFTRAGGVIANRIAKWNGQTWSALGSGMNYQVNALAVSGTHVYAGGAFTTAGGISAKCIAEWDGDQWTALGSGMSHDVWVAVFALAVSGTDLYAGGHFTTAGGVGAKYIAKWNGVNWSPLGAGMAHSITGSGDVRALAVCGPDLYAGGYFNTAGGTPANFVAKWDGTAWSALGSGMDNVVWALAMFGTDLYAGGPFTSAGGVSATHIAQWNGRAWSALGSGTDGNVRALATDTAAHLFAGGAFIRAGATFSPFVAKANLPAEYTVATGGGTIVVIDDAGHSDFVRVYEPTGGGIGFKVTGRAFSVDGAPRLPEDSGTLLLSGIGSITIDVGEGDDTVDVGSFSGPLPPLSINGSSAPNLLTVIADSMVGQTAGFAGTGGLAKQGAGTLTLSQDNSYQGNTTVSSGTLALVHASHNNVAASPNLILDPAATLDVTGLADGRLDLASGQTLKGSGSVIGTLGVAAGAAVAPGTSPGVLTCGSVQFRAGSTFAVEIDGALAGTGHDQLEVAGRVDLGGASLVLSGSYIPQTGDTFLLINNDDADAVSGTFSGMQEGDSVPFNGVDLTISYAGGSGNDVTLRRSPQPTAATLAYFRAIRSGLGPVALAWGTLVEIHTLGFRLERSTTDGTWDPLGSAVIPAEGTDQRPHDYRLEDNAPPAGHAIRYRLTEVDFWGRQKVLAEIRVEPAIRALIERSTSGMRLTFQGTPLARFIAETTADLAAAVWTRLDTVTLDSAGWGGLAIEVDEGKDARFFRLRQED